MDDEGVPEILRCPLDRLILQAKLFDMGEPKALLALTLDPPDLTNLENSILLLKEVSLPFLITDKFHIKVYTWLVCGLSVNLLIL